MLTLHQWLLARPHDAEEPTSRLETPSQFPCDWMFMASAEPVLILDAATGTIVEMNPPAAALFLTDRTSLMGTRLVSAFDAAGAATIQACITIAQTAGSAETLHAPTIHGGLALTARFSLFRAPSGTYLLVRLAAAGAPEPGNGGSADSVVFQAIDASPLGFLMTDRGFRIEYANRAFIDMVALKSPDDVCGTSLVRWLQLTSNDLLALCEQLSQRQAVSLLTTYLRSARDRRSHVEVCAVAVPNERETSWGFSISELPRLH